MRTRFQHSKIQSVKHTMARLIEGSRSTIGIPSPKTATSGSVSNKLTAISRDAKHQNASCLLVGVDRPQRQRGRVCEPSKCRNGWANPATRTCAAHPGGIVATQRSSCAAMTQGRSSFDCFVGVSGTSVFDNKLRRADVPKD
jgi:hypothetical protein